MLVCYYVPFEFFSEVGTSGSLAFVVYLHVAEAYVATALTSISANV